MIIPLDLVGSVLNFAGGMVLTLDALMIQRNIRIEEGARHLRDILDKADAGQILKDESGEPLDTDEGIQLWLSSRSLRWTRIGFILMTAGFLAELSAHLIPA